MLGSEVCMRACVFCRHESAHEKAHDSGPCKYQSRMPWPDLHTTSSTAGKKGTELLDGRLAWASRAEHGGQPAPFWEESASHILHSSLHYLALVKITESMQPLLVCGHVS
jgi:hypothetical protein